MKLIRPNNSLRSNYFIVPTRIMPIVAGVAL
jgi:hypothetical protein